MNKTHYQLCMEIRYATTLWRVHECLWRRVKGVLTTMTLVGGSAAVYSAIGPDGKVATAAGVIMAAIAAFDMTLSPTDKATEYAQQYKRYQKLLAESRQISYSDLHDRLELARVDDALVIHSLKDIAFKKTCLSNHLQDDTRFSRLQRIFDAFV